MARVYRSHYDTLPLRAAIVIKPAIVDDALKESHPEYVSKIKGTRVKAPLPANITIGLSNQIGQTWDFWKVGRNLFNASSTFGYNTNKGISERQFWQEVEQKDVSVELVFNAKTNAKHDVYDNCQQLLYYTAASDIDPGFYDLAWLRPVYIDVLIGTVATYRTCLIKTCDINYSTQTDADGYPMSATVSLTFITIDPLGFHWALNDGTSRAPSTVQKLAALGKDAIRGLATTKKQDLINYTSSTLYNLDQNYDQITRSTTALITGDGFDPSSGAGGSGK